jgi:hypothetical protein
MQARAKELPPGVVRFAHAFLAMQQQSHEAGYNPAVLPYGRDEVATLIKQCHQAIADLGKAPRSDLRAFVAWVLLK